MRRFQCIVLREWEKNFGPIQNNLDIIAKLLMPRFPQLCKPDQSLDSVMREVSKIVKRMADIGSRYVNLEGDLTAGFTLCVGNEIAETFWSKDLHKSGPMYDSMIKLVQSTPVVHMAPLYEELRHQLVQYRVDVLCRGQKLKLPITLRNGVGEGDAANRPLVMARRSNIVHKDAHLVSYDWSADDAFDTFAEMSEGWAYRAHHQYGHF